MNTRDPIAAAAAVLLLCSIVFLVSGIAASLLRDDGPGGRPVTLEGDRTGALGGAAVAAAKPQPVAPPAPARVAVGDDARLEQPHGPEVVIEGRVLDCQARPLAGASVQLALGLGSAPASLAAQDAPAVTTTEDGRFAFVGKEPIDAAVSITLLARAPGHASSVLRRTLEAGLSWLDVGDLELIEGGGIDGRIIDGQGRGLAAATVSLQLVSPGALASRWIDGDAIAKPASADASGAYRFANLPPGAYRIVASAAKMQASRPRAAVLVEDGKDTEVAPITLSPGLELNGVVVGPGGLAVAGADVRVRSAAASERFDDHTTAREDGRFHMEHLPPAPLQVDVQAAGYLQAHQGDVDAAAGGELVIHLESGLGLSGTVLDADTGVPIERFAARIRVLGSLERGTPAQLLRRRIDALRRQASEAKTAEDRSRRETTLLDLEARLATLERNERATRARRVPADMPPVLDRPGGRFAFAGLDEGIHALDVTAPGYAFTSTAPIEVRRDLKTLALRVELRRGWSLAGVVVANREGAPVANASVELIAVEDARIATGEILAAGSAAPFSWAFASTGAHGDGILSARTDGEGRFRLGPVPPGCYLLSATHPQVGQERTEPFELSSERDDLRLVLRAMASVSGRVAPIPADPESDVIVLAVGGFGTMRSVRVDADGRYRLDALPPGRYVVRAALGQSDDATAKQVAAIFAGGGSADGCNLTLADGERRELDLTLAVAPVGVVEGSVTINGEPARGLEVVLRPATAAVGAGRALRASPDGRGQFALNSVPPGDYTVHVTRLASRQELHRAPLTVSADRVAWVQVSVSVGGLSGRVESGDQSPLDRLEGTITILPGATAAPADLREYRRTHRVHTMRVRAGTFADDSLTSGPALLIVEIRGRQPAQSMIDIPSRGTSEIVVAAGKPLP